MANKKAAKDPQDAVLAGHPITDGDTSETPTQSATPTGIQYGTPCRTVSDMSDADVTWILPKKDYRGACYMWPVPNGEIVIPGNALYRMPTTKAVMTDCFGFMPSDNLGDFGVFAVPHCSDWQGYVAKRNAGQWSEEEAKIEQMLQNAVPVAPAPSPSATNPAWDWGKVTELNLQLLPRKKDGSIAVPTSEDTRFREIWKTYLHALVPSLDLSGVEERQPTYYAFTSAASIKSAVDLFFSGACAETVKEECQQATKSGNWYSGNGTPLVQVVAPADKLGSYKLGDEVLDASTIKLEVSIMNCASAN